MQSLFTSVNNREQNLFDYHLKRNETKQKPPITGMTLHRQETNIILSYGGMALRKRHVRLGKQLGAKLVPVKNEDPSLNPKHSCKDLGKAARGSTRKETDRSGGSLAIQSS